MIKGHSQLEHQLAARNAARWSTIIRIVPPLGVAAGIGAFLGYSQLPLTYILIVLISALLATPIAYRVVQRQFDVFEPIVLINAAMLVIFVARPLSDILSGLTVHLGYDVLPQINDSLLVVVIGVGVFEGAYLLGPSVMGLSLRLPPPPASIAVGRSILMALALLVLGSVLFAAFVLQTGGTSTLVTLLAGRNPQAYQALFYSSTSYLYQGVLLASPAALLLIGSSTKRNQLAMIALAGVSLVFVVLYGALTGNRVLLFLLFGPVGILWYLRSARRPSLATIIALGFVVVVGLGFLRDSRNVGTAANQDRSAAFVQAVTHPGDELLALVQGGDADMFDSLANEMSVVPKIVPFQYGATIRDPLIRIVPRTVWTNKTPESYQILVTTLWPERYAISRFTPQFSILGPLYLDGGYFTVVLGMFAFGVVSRLSWTYFARFPQNRGAQMMYAMWLPILLIVVREYFTDALAYLPFTVLPLAGALVFAGRGKLAPSATHASIS